MGKALQVRGTVQAVDLRTLNAEISEVLKLDLDEVSDRAVREFDLAAQVVDKEVSFADEGIDLTDFVYLTADAPLLLKINSTLAPAFATTFLMHFGNIQKLFLSAGATGAHVRIIAMKT